jgi:hypothetical protein
MLAELPMWLRSAITPQKRKHAQCCLVHDYPQCLLIGASAPGKPIAENFGN